MIKIDCPFCGVRNHEEFTYGGSAEVKRPHFNDEGANISEKWIDYVYYRPNPRGINHEYWHHSFGCRSWLLIARDTTNHEIHKIRIANPHHATFVAQFSGKPAVDKSGGNDG